MLDWVLIQREKERVCVCACERQRERERMQYFLHQYNSLNKFFVFEYVANKKNLLERHKPKQ